MIREGTRYRIGGAEAVLYADADYLEALLDRAGAGQWFVYARGGNGDPANTTMTRVRDWAARGWVYCQSATIAGEKRYSVARLPGWRGAEVAEPVAAAPTALPREAARVLDVLTEFDGQACPSNAEIAELADLPDRHAAAYRVRCLREAGLVTIEREGRFGPRRVTICEGAGV